MSNEKDIFTVTYRDVEIAAEELVGFDVGRKPHHYLLLTDGINQTTLVRRFPDNPHGYTEAISWLEELGGYHDDHESETHP